MVKSYITIAILGVRRLRRSSLAYIYSTIANIVLSHNPAVTLVGKIHATGLICWKIDPRGKLKIGPNVRINSGPLVNPLGAHRKMVFYVAKNAQMNLGRGVGLSCSTIVSELSVDIHDNVFVGADVLICDSDMHPICPQARIEHRSDKIRMAPIVIKENAFIGARAIILKGSQIGRGAVIGAGAVVSGLVPDGEIWAGNPARRIGSALNK